MEKRLVSWQWEHQYSRIEQDVVFKQTIYIALLFYAVEKTTLIQKSSAN